jgi:hypothetical protein
VNAKQLVISSYSDLSELSPKIKNIHFRKFVSKKMLNTIKESCPELDRISFSSSAAKRLQHCSSSLPTKAEIQILARKSGRPNLIESFLLIKNEK